MIKSSLDAADMFLTRHMMQGIVLPRNPLDKHSHPASPVMLLFAVIRIHPSSCKSSTIVMRAGFHPKIGMIWCGEWWMKGEFYILFVQVWWAPDCGVGCLQLSRWARGSCSCDAHLTSDTSSAPPPAISDQSQETEEITTKIWVTFVRTQIVTKSLEQFLGPCSSKTAKLCLGGISVDFWM